MPRKCSLLDLISDDSRKLFDGLCLEDGCQAQFFSKRAFDLRDYPNGEQRMAAQIKEFVVDPDRMNIENFLPDFCQIRFDLVSRRRIFPLQPRPGHVWFGKGFAVNLAIRRKG